jgi:hypothetical protein
MILPTVYNELSSAFSPNSVLHPRPLTLGYDHSQSHQRGHNERYVQIGRYQVKHPYDAFVGFLDMLHSLSRRTLPLYERFLQEAECDVGQDVNELIVSSVSKDGREVANSQVNPRRKHSWYDQ